MKKTKEEILHEEVLKVTRGMPVEHTVSLPGILNAMEVYASRTITPERFESLMEWIGNRVADCENGKNQVGRHGWSARQEQNTLIRIWNLIMHGAPQINIKFEPNVLKGTPAPRLEHYPSMEQYMKHLEQWREANG